MTACAADCEPCSAYCAEQIVCSVKKSVMPAAEVMNRKRRPQRSTWNDANTAQNRFHMARMPVMSGWMSVSVMPIVSNTWLR